MRIYIYLFLRSRDDNGDSGWSGGATHNGERRGEVEEEEEEEEKPGDQKKKGEKERKKFKRGLRGSNEGEKRKREREREIEVRKRREFGNPIGFCCASDSPIIETAFYTWKQLHGGTTVDSVQYRPYSVLYCYDVVLAFTQARMPAITTAGYPLQLYNSVDAWVPEVYA